MARVSLLPAVGSGTLQLWLRADVGVETNSAGQVSEWDDLSGNENDAVQTNANLQPFLANPSTVGNASVVRFNGIQNSSEGDFLQGTNSVGVSNALTAFMFYEMNSGAPAEQMGMFIGVPGSFGGSRGDYIPGGQMAFTTWSYDYLTGYTIPTNTYRIWTNRFNTNQNLAQLFDDTATSTTNFSKSTSGQSPPQAGYYVGGLNPAVEFVGTGLNFGGDIGEILVYQGALSDTGPPDGVELPQAKILPSQRPGPKLPVVFERHEPSGGDQRDVLPCRSASDERGQLHGGGYQCCRFRDQFGGRVDHCGSALFYCSAAESIQRH